MRVQPAGQPLVLDDDLLIEGDNANVLASLPDGAFDLIYLDPPFNTGRAQRREVVRSQTDPSASRVGFGGRRYRSSLLSALYFHIDAREAHPCKLLLDELFGRDAFLNELIWSYDYGAKPRRRWPAKHDTILVYVKTPGAHHFDSDAVEREPYMAPGLVSAEKALRGKLPTDVWWHTIVPTNGAEKTGYPTQKPEGVLRRIVAASSRPGGWCLDPFAGSGTLGAVCRQLGRRFVLIDSNPVATQIAADRLSQEVLSSSRPARAART